MSIRKRILGNISSLYLLQLAGYILPLVSFPYVLRIIGLERYGTVVYAISVVQILLVFIDFSFNYTASQRVSEKRDDPAAVSRIFSSVTTIKLALMAICLLVLGTAVALVPSWREQWPLYAVLSPMLLGEVLFPYWLFLGLERMSFVTILNIGSRIVTVALLFVLVHEPDDYVIFAALQAAPYLIAGVLAQFAVRRIAKVRYTFHRNWAEYRAILSESGDAFLGKLPAHVYGRGAMMVLGLYANDRELGYFAVAYRLSGLLSQLTAPISQGIYPSICRELGEDPKVVQRYRKILLSALLAGYTLVLIPYNVFSDLILLLLNGEVVPRIEMLMHVLTPMILFSAINVLLNVFIMAMKIYGSLRWMHVGAAVLFLSLSFPLSYAYHDWGMAMTLVIVEGYIAITSFYLTRRIGSRFTAQA